MSKAPMNWIFTGDAVVLIVDGKSHTIASSHSNFQGILDALDKKDWETAGRLADIATAIKSYVSADNDVDVRANGVWYKGEQLGGAVVDRILKFMKDNRPTAPLIEFVKRIMENPSFNSRQRLYEFLEKNAVPITERGTFLAYKAVQPNYLSKTAGREKVEVSTDGGKTWKEYVGYIPNNVGNVVKVDRASVDDNPNNHCSKGLHAGGLKYVNSFASYGDKKVIVEIDPADVVSVPNDCDFGKLRAAKYTVLCDFKGEFTAELVNATQPYDGSEDSGEEEDNDSDY